VEHSADVPLAPGSLEPRAPSSGEVHEQLDRILRNPGFARAPSLSGLLRHLVEHGLSGRVDGLKEFTIAVEVFGRPDTFDPQTDTIVRVQARRLRARLDAYYADTGLADPVVFDLPRGRYTVKARYAEAASAHGPRLPLPVSSTPLVGRERESAALISLLMGGPCRLVTVTGAGGSGKTRLARHVAAEIDSDLPGGVFFVSLASVADEDEVVSAIARALGLRVPGTHTLADALMAHVRQRLRQRSLLLLDNFEHLVAVAPLLVRLLEAAERLVILVTSRSVLRVTGEHEFSLLPLPLPDIGASTNLEELSRNPAVTLFVQRAAAANPGFVLSSRNARTVAEICCRVDGLPLALELAAARIRMLSPTALLDRLQKRLDLLTMGARDLPERQQTIRATIEWSHQLLTEGERSLFRRLAVFAGGTTIEGVEAVCNARLDLPMDVLNGMSSLVDEHLVQRVGPGEDEPRFRMLETIREFALEQLACHREDAITWRAHAAYCLVLAEEGAVLPNPQVRERWLARCEVEHDNLRAALDDLVAHGEVEWAMRLGAALYLFWDEREYLVEGRRRLETILRMPGPPTVARAAVAKYAGALANHQGDFGPAQVLHREAMEIYARVGDRRGVVGQLISLGVQEYRRGHYARAQQWFEQSVETCRQLEDPRAVAAALGNLANAVRAQGDCARAVEILNEAFATFNALADRAGEASTLNQLGDVARDRGDFAEACRLYTEGATRYQETGDQWGLARSLLDLGCLASQSGDHAAARAHLAGALKLFLDLNYRKGIANVLDEFACLAAHQLDYTRTLVLAAAASELRERLGAAPGLQSRARTELAIEAARRHLTREARERAWMAGRHLSLDEVPSYAASAAAHALPTESSTDR
jgi:predicted ATPase